MDTSLRKEGGSAWKEIKWFTCEWSMLRRWKAEWMILIMWTNSREDLNDGFDFSAFELEEERTRVSVTIEKERWKEERDRNINEGRDSGVDNKKLEERKIGGGSRE